MLGLLVHGVLFISSATQYAIVPMIPALSRLHHLTAATAGLLISAPGLATLAVSAPAGLLADRLGAKRVTVGATMLLVLGTLGQALPSLPLLLLGRLVFGVGYGVVWTTAVAWLARTQQDTRSSSLGAVATSSAAGMAAGPGLGGLAAQWLGLSAPFLIVGAVAGGAAVALALQPAGRSGGAPARNPLRAMALLAPRCPAVLASAIGLAVVGAVSGVTQLLVPLDLHRAGVSTGATGILFSIAAGLYVLVSASIARSGARLMTVRATAVAALILSLSLLPASVASAPAVLVGVLFVTTLPRAMISTVTYPLATDSGTAAHLPVGAVVGLLNGAWAVGLTFAPLLAGVLAGGMGSGAGYLAAAIPGVLGALWLLSRQTSRPLALRLAAHRP
jgi:predicted MFS family arabinose efflux permease